jgi:chemotaxis signal transduction protein/nucleoid-associated protein YgaU
MIGAHPVSLADLSYCIGLASARRAGRYPVLVPADHDLSVSFVAEQEAGMVQVPCSAVYPLPAYLQTPFIDSCVRLDEKLDGKLDGQLVPLINIRAVHRRISAGDYTPPTPQCCLPGLTEEKKEREKRTSSPDALRVFTCRKKSFAASAAYFSSEQALPPGVPTRLPLMPEFVRGITLHNNRILTVLDIGRYLQLSSTSEDNEEKWLVGEVEGQEFAFVIDADQGLLSADSTLPVPLPLLVQSDWQQSVVLHDRKIIPVLNFSELLANRPDAIRSRSRTVPRDVQSDGRFEAVFGQQQVEIVEFSLCTMVHALPDLEVADSISFSHCQRLTGTKGLVVGVTMYRKELLPVLDPARCFGRQSRPVAGWKLVLVCNGDLRVLVLVEEVLGKRTLSVGEQRALPFTTPHSSVYGCYPVDGRVGLIFNIPALAVFFDEEQIRELFLFADDLLPPISDAEKDLGKQEDEQKNEQKNEFLPESLLPASPASGRESFAADQKSEKNVSVRLTEERDSLVQSVVAAMLSRKKDKAPYAAKKDNQKNQDDEAVEDSLECTEEPERFKEIREDSDNVFLSVMAAMLSRKKTGSKSAVEAVSEGVEKGAEVGYISLAASPVLLTDEQDDLITSALASMAPETSQHAAEPPADDSQEVSEMPSIPDESLRHADESQGAGQPPAVPSADEEEETFTGFADPEESIITEITESESEPKSVLLTQEQEKLLQSALISAFPHEEKEDRAEGEKEPEDAVVPAAAEQAAASEEISLIPSESTESTESPDSPRSLEDFKATDGDTDQTENQGQQAPHTWNILEDADAFPELRAFICQVAEAQQADSPLALSHTDFVKNVTFPPLSSPDPRKIKERLDKMRQKEQELLFQETVREMEEVPDVRPKDENRKRTKLWVFLLLPILLSGFLLWFFVFRNQEVFFGNQQSIKPKTRLAEINRAASTAPEQRATSKAAEKGDRESTSASPVVSAPVVLKSDPESESASEGREEAEQEVLTEEIPAEEIVEVPVEQPARVVPERTATRNSVKDFPEKIEPEPESVSENHGKQQEKKPEFQEQDQSEEGLVGNIHESDQGHAADAADDGAGDPEDDEIVIDVVDDIAPESAMYSEKDAVEGMTGAPSDDTENESKQAVTDHSPEQKVTAEAEETQADGLSAETASDSTRLISGALPERDRPETDQSATERADGEQEQTAGVEITGIETINVALNNDNERTTPADQQKTPLMSPVKSTSDQTSHTVSKGDTLWDISEQYTGSGFNYPDVARKNKIANPDLIYPDQQVTLPVKK